MGQARIPGMNDTLRGGSNALDGTVTKLQWKAAGADATSFLFANAGMVYSDPIPTRGATQLAIGVDVDSTGVGAPAQTAILQVVGIGDDDAGVGTNFVQSSITAGTAGGGTQQWLPLRDQFWFSDLAEKQFIYLPCAWHFVRLGIVAAGAATNNQVVVLTLERLLAAGAAAMS